MKFFDKTADEIYNEIGNKRRGCYPISNTGLWHSGIHVYFDSEHEPVINPLESSIVSCNVDKSKNWNYFVLEHFIKLPSKSKKKTGYTCYNLIGNLKSNNDYEDLLDKENDFSEDNLKKLRNLPFYVHASVMLSITPNTDPNNYKFFFKSFTNEFYLDYTDSKTIDLGKSIKHVIGDQVYIKSGTKLSSSTTKKKIGVLKTNISLLRSKAIMTGENVITEIKGEDIELSDGVPTGIYILNNGEFINDYANIRIDNKDNFVLWVEKEKYSNYVGFGIALKKNKDFWKSIEKKLEKILSLETANNINNLIASQDDKCDTIILLSKNSKDNVFPYLINDQTKNAYKINDSDGNTIKPLAIKNEDYTAIEREIVGFFRRNKFYESRSDLWTDCNLSYTVYEPIIDSLAYISDFEFVRVVNDDGKDYTKIDQIPQKQRDSIVQKVRFYLLNSTEKKYDINSAEVFSKIINISDKGGIHKFNGTTLIKNYPATEIIGDVSGKTEVEIENIAEVIENILDEKSCIWIKNGGGFYFLDKTQYSSLKFKLTKKIPQKGDVVPAGQVLGFPYSRQNRLGKDETSSLSPYIDYALFFDEDITSKQSTLYRLTVPKYTMASIEKRTFCKTDEIVVCPPWGRLTTAPVAGVKDYVALSKMAFEIYAYPKQVENNKLKASCNELWICNFPVVVEHGTIIKVCDENKDSVFAGDAEKTNKLIEMLNDIYDNVKSANLISTVDKNRKPVYLYNAELIFKIPRIIKAGFARSNVCQSFETYATVTTSEEAALPEDFNTTMSDEDLAKITVNNSISIQLNDEIYIVPINDVQKEDLLDYIHENCETLNFGKNPLISDKNILPDSKLYIPKDRLDDFRKAFANLLASKQDPDGGTLDSYIYHSSEDIPRTANPYNDEPDCAIYRADKDYSVLLKSYLDKLLCCHPLEWDKSLFDNMKEYGRDIAPFSDSDCDIAADIGTARKKYYFANPIYFYQKMEMIGLLFHNPYEGKTYDDIYNTGNGVCEGIDMGTRIVDNPGFAPVYDGVNGRKDVEGFAGINGFFNEDYSKVHSDFQQYWHEGVDFAGIEGTVIKSLVFGEVVDFGTHNKVHNGTGMGDYMIVRDDYDKNKYYLLLHLAYESWKKYNVGIGTKVYPGMKVAGVGKPDYSKTAYHLHVSVVVLDGAEQPIDMEMSENGKKIKKTGIIRNSAYLFPIWGYKDKMRDPFNHKTTWKGRKK